MKFLLILIFVFNLYGDEIQRINSIVSDIGTLRVNYKKSQEELKFYKERVKDLEKELKKTKNIIVNHAKYVKTQANIFPKLKMRINIVYTNPGVFRLNKDAPIYNGINGAKIDKWEEGTSFTSNRRSSKFIKITGFFINRQWVKAKKSLWVKVEDVLKRDKK